MELVEKIQGGKGVPAEVFSELQKESDALPAEHHGTAHMRALLDSDGFFVVPKGVTDISAGQEVSYLSIKESFE